MGIYTVYLLDDEVWIIADTDTTGLRLYVAGHREQPRLVTVAMYKRNEVPQEVLEWFKGE
ncbi:MAG TPA: hypothetical protein VLA24_09400 [Pseudomonadales bacterium]|nr:hypothetical protein [Pseudomonadales bacterium]